MAADGWPEQERGIVIPQTLHPTIVIALENHARYTDCLFTKQDTSC